MTGEKPPAPKSPKQRVKVDVINPRYEGATPLMVARALLQRPKKSGEPSKKENPKTGAEKPSRRNAES